MYRIFRIIVSLSAIPWLFCVAALRGQAPNFTLSTQVANSLSSGTVVNQLACWGSGSPIAAKVATNCGLSPGNGTIIGIVSGGAGASGNANIIQSGIAQCLFSNTVSAMGDYVVPSAATGAGECYDYGATAPPVGTQVVGVVSAVPASGSLANVFLYATISSPGAISISTAPVTTGSAQLYMSSPIADPAQPTSVVNNGTTGTTTYGYEVAAAVGCCSTAASPELQTATGNATLNMSNFNTVNWTAVAGATSYNVYRTTSAGTPSSLGLLASLVACCSFADKGSAASYPAPTVNATGYTGIGTPTPQRPFEIHVYEPGELSDFLMQNDNPAVGSGSGIIISAGPVSSAVNLGGLHAVTTATSNSVSLWEWYGGIPDNLVTLTGGNVGIGDAAPASLFSVGSGSQFQVNTNGSVAEYNNIATVSNGVPAEYATADLTLQNGALTNTTLYTPANTGMFRVSYWAKVTRGATTSSKLGAGTNSGFILGFNDGTDNIAQTVTVGSFDQTGAVITPANGNSGNSATTAMYGSIAVYGHSSTAFTFSYGYTSSGATAMQYEIHVKVEAL